MLSSAHPPIRVYNSYRQTPPFTYNENTRQTQLRLATILGAVSFVTFLMLLYWENGFFHSSLPLPYAPTGTTYRGTPWINDRTVSVKTIGETKFARCDVHTVKSEDGKSEINDWLFMEEMDAVNVAVVTENGNFVVFEQGKYGIPGITLSPVGGFVDAGEAPWESAKREVMEELGLGSRHTLEQMRNVDGDMPERAAFAAAPKIQRTVDQFNLAKGDVSGDPDWIFLGRYRTAANRGAGFVYTYLLKKAVQILPEGGTIQFISSGDDEKQKVRFLPINEVEERTLNGEFQEIKWAATHALALMHLKR